MSARHYLLQSLNLLNLVMTATAIAFFIYFLNPLLETQVSVKVPVPDDISPGMPRDADETKKLSIADYSPIGEQNIFHPDRMIPEEKKSPAPVVQPRPELILHGTMMTGELKIGYLEDKRAAQKSPGRNAPYIVVKEGDKVSGYTLKAITENMVVLANGEEQMTLYLDELKDRKGEITGPAKPSASVQVQSPAAPAPPQTTPRPAVPPPPQRPSIVQPAPSPPPSPPRGSASQPVSPTATSGFSGQPNVKYAPPRPSTPAPSSPIRSAQP